MMSRVRLYLKLARFDHWIKQAFILPGIVIALALMGIENHTFALPITRVILGIIATSLIASANYVINEWLDARYDAFHPTKKNRPVVAHDLKPAWIIAEYVLFCVAGFAVALVARSSALLWLLAALWLMGVLYNVPPIRLKEIVYVDVLSESVNNAIRLLIGWFLVATTKAPPISVVFGYWMGGAFLMAAKRFAEYRMIGDQQVAGQYRRSFMHYSEKSLLISAFFYALLAVFFCGIFMIKYKIELLIAIPFLCGLFCFYLYICYKPDSSAQHPEHLFAEKGLILYLALFIVLLCVLMFVHIPALQVLLEPIRMGR